MCVRAISIQMVDFSLLINLVDFSHFTGIDLVVAVYACLYAGK